MQRQPLRELPTNKNPVGSRCITLSIPDDDEWERAAFSELSRLAIWALWQRDTGKNGKPVADKWRDALLTWSRCDVTHQTLIEYDDACGLKWSYDNGDTWTNVSLASCADSEILDKIDFMVSDGKLLVTLNGGTEWGEIYNAPALADQEIIDRISFGMQDTALTVSLNGGTEIGEIYDAAPIADAEISSRIIFSQDGLLLRASLDEGVTTPVIYDPTGLIPSSSENIVPPDFVERVAGEIYEFDLICPAYGHVMLPVLLDEGDSIQVTNLRGAWADTLYNPILDSDPPMWIHPRGWFYTSGLVTDENANFGGALQGSLIALYNGLDREDSIQVYDLASHVMPSGVDAAALWFTKVGDYDYREAYPAEIGGEYLTGRQIAHSGYAAFHVTVECAPETWCYNFDFTTSAQGFVTFPGDGGSAGGVWTNNRWQGTARWGNYYTSFKRTGFSSCRITHVHMVINCGAAAGTGTRQLGRTGNTVFQTLPRTAGAFTLDYDVDVTTTELWVNITSSGTSAVNYCTSIRLSGTGANPFGADNC